MPRRTLVVASSCLALLVACAPVDTARVPPVEGTPSPAVSSTPVPSATPAPPSVSSPAPTPAPTSSTPAATPTPATPAPSATPSSATPAPVGQGRTVTINYSGDLLWHNSLWKSAALDAKKTGKGEMDFYPQLSGLTDYVSRADLAICHSEVPFAPVGGPYKNYPLFAAPPAIAPALKQVGWDVSTTASNHSVDQGFKGLVRTIEMHAAAGILTSGTYATEAASKTPVIFTTAAGVKVGVVSSTFGLNGLPMPEGKPWAVTLLDADEVLAQAKRARDAGAQIVVVHMHAGTEYESMPNSEQKEFARAVTASPYVDLVVGQHAHVVQPITTVNGKWVAYGSGNLIAASGPAKPRTYDGYLATFTFSEQPDGTFRATAAEFAPTFIKRHSDGSPARVWIISEALKAGLGDPAALRESAARTRKTVLKLDAQGLTEH